MYGYYHDASLDFYPFAVIAPNAPNAWGEFTEIPKRIATAWGSYANYSEALVWAGRHVGLENFADTYTVRPFADIDLADYQLVDIPAPLSADYSAARIVIESKRWTHNIAGAWDIELTGRTFGVTATSTTKPKANIPATSTPPVPLPVPVPPVVYGDGSKVALFLCEIYDDGGTDYFRPVVVATEDFTSASPTWAIIDQAGMDAAIAPDASGDKREPLAIDFSQGGTEPYGLYITVEKELVAGTNYLSRVLYNGDPFGAGTWSEIAHPTDWAFAYNNIADDRCHAAFAQPSPGLDGKVLVATNSWTGLDFRDVKIYRGKAIYLCGVEEAGQSGLCSSGTAFNSTECMLCNSLGWDGSDASYLISAQVYEHLPRFYEHKLRIPSTSGFAYTQNIADLCASYGIGYAGDPEADMPAWIDTSATGQPIVPSQSALGFYVYNGVTGKIEYGYTSKTATGPTVDPGGTINTNIFKYFGIRIGQCATLAGTIAIPQTETADMFIEEGYLAAHTNVDVNAAFTGDKYIQACTLYGGDDTTDPYIIMCASTDAEGDAPANLEIKAYNITAATWASKEGNLAAILSGTSTYKFGNFKPTAVFYGDEAQV